MLEHLTEPIAPADAPAARMARDRQARLARPPGSLGRLEDLGTRLAGIAGTCPPPVPAHPVVVIAAADHGVHAQGVSDWPQAVTTAMVRTVAAGSASVNALARAVDADIVLLDVGTAGRAPAPHGVVQRRVRAGTRDVMTEPAMSVDECMQAIEAGVDVTRELLEAGADLLVLGDLGVGNTTVSACLVSAFTGADPARITGRGANADDQRTGRKIAAVAAALERHGPDRDPLRTLASLGGLEHAALVGVALAGAAARVPVLLDGVITNAAALAATALAPAVADHMVASHMSAEPGASAALAHLGLPALLDLDLRLGEGTGGLLAVPLVQAAARALSEVATLEDVLQR